VKKDLLSILSWKKVANLVIVPRICLKHPYEEYSKMDLCKLKMHFSNLPQVAKSR